ncbi:STY4528 family pathogenicity island replication protein [Phocoenobacter skyensis]|uniref:STY4528 family pathogenicity island replication protein n=1 Tax=Phocoenobacter skyensis TaxID=97481 RepID=UPI00277A4787|nr:STY4528 family pathogenicity island replication protein [Pasteurella skyensis]MDP8185283.1 STY4528 family pathogenicity island replication protein [Pasteurella skyensis]
MSSDKKNNLFDSIFESETRPKDGLLFFGNEQETVPKRLLYDPCLTPRAKFAWQLIKSKAREFQEGVFPSYEVLGKLLSDKPFDNTSLSRKKISQTLLLLRLTRWLTLCETVRNEKGHIKGNLYLLHDEPVPILDAVQLDSDYLDLLKKNLKHKDQIVSGVANYIVEKVMTDKSQWHYVSHVDWLKTRYQSFKQERHSTGELSQKIDNLLSSNRELSQKTDNSLSSNRELSQKIGNSLSSNRELSQKIDNLQSSPMELSQKIDNLQSSPMELSQKIDNSQYKYSTVYINKYCTGRVDEIDFENVQFKLSEFDKNAIAQAMNGLDLGLCQAVLFEANIRIQKGDIKKPLGYLMSIIKKAQIGSFKPYLLEQYLSSQDKRKSLDIPSHFNKNNTEKTKLVLITQEERTARAEAIRRFRESLVV